MEDQQLFSRFYREYYSKPITEPKELKHLLGAILEKKDWQRKIYDENILYHWKEELEEQQVDSHVFDIVTSQLRTIKDTFMQNLELADYDSFIEVSTVPYELLNKEFAQFLDDKANLNPLEKENDLTIEVKDGRGNIVVKKHIEPHEGFRLECNKEVLYERKQQIIPHVETNVDRYFAFHKHIVKMIQQQKEGIPLKLKQAYMRLVDKAMKKGGLDVQPWTEGKVFNLFHPSFNCGLHTAPTITFQWLPTNVSITYNGDKPKVQFLTPIHNLHLVAGGKASWEKAIGAILECFIPYFNKVCERLLERKEFRLGECQFIMKAQEMQLKPGERMKEGNIHLEGTSAEKIIASGIYYPKVDMAGKLRFFTRVEKPSLDSLYDFSDRNRGDDDDGYRSRRGGESLHAVYPFEQVLEVNTEEDLCLVFPNSFYHQVSGMYNSSKTEVARRHILVFWLVHPDIPIKATSEETEITRLPKNYLSILRECLMYERSEHAISNEEPYHEGYSLCEH